jgi:hypothetical protein
MQSALDPVWERLLRGGVARRRARRYLAELSDHLDDLIADEGRTASDVQIAEARALARLGSPEILAQALIARREFRALGAKAPVATYVIAPSAALALVSVLGVAGVVCASTWLRRTAGMASDPPAWLGAFAGGVAFFSKAMLPILLGWAVAAMASASDRRRSGRSSGSACWPR